MKQDCRKCKSARLVSNTKSSGWDKETYNCKINGWYYNDWKYERFPCIDFEERRNKNAN